MYRCYCCGEFVEYGGLGYECLNPNDEEQRGICRLCDGISVDKWKEVPDSNHLLFRVHVYSREFNNWWKMVDEVVPGWCGMKENVDGTVTVYYYETPSDETHIIDRKSVIVPSCPANKCDCCRLPE